MKITPYALGEVHKHAQDGYPFEICGMLITSRGSDVVTEVRRVRNAVVDRARDRYEMDPRDQIRIQRECDALSLDIVGYYHSHPDHGSYASETDRLDAWPGFYYLVASCMAGVVGDVKVFVKPDWDASEMPEEPLEII